MKRYRLNLNVTDSYWDGKDSSCWDFLYLVETAIRKGVRITAANADQGIIYFEVEEYGKLMEWVGAFADATYGSNLLDALYEGVTVPSCEHGRNLLNWKKIRVFDC